MFTPTFAVGLVTALLALLFLYLSINVVRKRVRYKVEMGTGNNTQVEQAARAHANFAEYVPLTLILLYACLGLGTHPLVIYVACALLLVARLLHAWGLSSSRGITKGRTIGFTATAITIFGLSIACLVSVLGKI